MKEKMRKTVCHYNDARNAHSLTFSCNKKLPLLSKERSCLWFLESLKVACEKHGFTVVGFVIMPNHVHLLIYPKQGEYDIASFLKSLKLSVSKKARRYLEEESPEWMKKLSVGEKGSRFGFWLPGPGYDRNINSAQELEEKIKYIHKNPVRKGLVDSAAEWRWSSAGQYEGKVDVDFQVETITFRYNQQ